MFASFPAFWPLFVLPVAFSPSGGSGRSKKPAIEKTTQAFDEADAYLSIADKAIVDVSDRLKTQASLLHTTLTNDSSKQGFFGSFVAKTMARQVAPNVNEAQRSLERVTEASIVVNSILESLQEGPFDSLDKLDTNQIRNLQTQMDGVTKTAWDLGDLLNNPQSPGSESATENRGASPPAWKTSLAC